MGRSGEDRPIDGLPQVSHGQPGWALYKLLWPSQDARPSYSPSVSIRSLMLQEGYYVTPNPLYTLGQAATQPLPQTFQSVRQCHPWYLLQVASLPCMFRLLSLLCTFCTTVACNQLACVQTQFGEFFWRGCLPRPPGPITACIVCENAHQPPPPRAELLCHTVFPRTYM